MGSNVGSNMSSGNIHKLTALKIKKILKAGRYSGGNWLYLVIKDTGARQWVLRLVIRGKRHDMGLGSSTLVSLEEARDLARQYRRIAREDDRCHLAESKLPNRRFLKHQNSI